ncbi:HRI1 domain protein [Phlyctema vagabunda]|uniref:Protein HRI1 n=1 Tax=Phlyctema vagabunda TaxID=108571 RepID=A0ABR4PK70_9HELO
MSKPHISIRKSIKWGDAEAFENTNTLVLTSAGKHYVDIRVYLPTSPTDPQKLEWGFAGTSKSTPPHFSGGKLDKPGHSQWFHWVDNTTKEEIQDEGYMYPIEDSNEVRETGSMAHPETGEMTAYEEIWTDVEIVKVGNQEKFVSWVMKLDDEETKTRGMICRIGAWVQGVLKIGDEMSVVRYKWDEQNSQWQLDLSMGRFDMPRDVALETERELKTGEEFAGWSVVESHYWT